MKENQLMKNVSNKVAWDIAVKYAMIVTVMMIGGLFLTGCGGYITGDYIVRNEAQLREAFAIAENNETVHITLDADIQLQGGELRVPTGATIIIDTPRRRPPMIGNSSTPRSITKIAGEERHFYVPHQSTLNLAGPITIQSQQSALNTAPPTVDRGGITVNGGTLNINGIINLRNNRWSDGGGVSVENGGTFNKNGSGNINGNVASGNGGGIFVQTNSRFNRTGSGDINGNRAGGNGGGVFVQGNSSFIRSGSGDINENTAGGSGGGIFIHGNSSFNRTGSGNINRNTAGGSGGGIFVQANSTVSRSGSGNINENIAQIDGGGIFANGIRITRSGSGNISGNTAQRGGGIALLNGAQFNSTGSGSVSNNTGGNIDEIDDDSNLPINNEPNIIETPIPEPQPETGGGSNQRH